MISEDAFNVTPLAFGPFDLSLRAYPTNVVSNAFRIPAEMLLGSLPYSPEYSREASLLEAARLLLSSLPALPEQGPRYTPPTKRKFW